MTNNITDTKSLARGLATAKNYLYEATMSDYSMDSINRGQDQLNEVLAMVNDAGLNPDDLVIWDGDCWKVRD